MATPIGKTALRNTRAGATVLIPRWTTLTHRDMLHIPRTSNTPFVRTDFSSEPIWQQIVDAVGRESPDGFRAYISIVNDAALSGADAGELIRLAARDAAHRLLLVADSTTMSHDERPILCIDLLSAESTIRVVPSALWSIENNLSLANMDFEDFAEATDHDGIFRGFT